MGEETADSDSQDQAWIWERLLQSAHLMNDAAKSPYVRCLVIGNRLHNLWATIIRVLTDRSIDCEVTEIRTTYCDTSGANLR